MTLKTSLAIVALLFAGNALAQPQDEQPKTEKHEDETLKTAGHIASQPARDVGIAKAKIPEVLLKAVDQPYRQPASRTCAGYYAAIAELNGALGPDFDSNVKNNQSKFGQIAAVGGAAVVDSLIPFRGVVREVSGAAPAERRLNAAINAGLARRGFLRGMAQAKNCKLPVTTKRGSLHK